MNKVAILIDGGFFLKRLSKVAPNVDQTCPQAVADEISRRVDFHLEYQNDITRAQEKRSLLHRVFYYDATPYKGQVQLPISKQTVDYAQSDIAHFRLGLFDCLRHMTSTALRLGVVQRKHGWALKEKSMRQLLNGNINLEDLTDRDFFLGLEQKAVDMRIGMDIAALSLKKQANTIVLVTGDADFVPALKLARREGMRVVLDSLTQSVGDDLFEHIDDLHSGVPRPIGLPKTRPRRAIPPQPTTR